MITSKLKKILLLNYICIASMSAAIITPALPYIKQTYQLTNSSLEWIISLFLLGYVIGQLIYAPLANRFGRLTALRFGLVINIIGILWCIMAVMTHSYLLLLAGRLITALGAASGLTCTFMLINELLSPESAKQAFSFTIVAFTVGIGITVSLGGLITQYLHWQYCFLVLLFHGALMLALTWQFSEPLKVSKALNPKGILIAYLQTLKNKELIIFSIIMGFISAFAYGYSAAAPVYTQINLHLTPSDYGYWNLLNMIGMLGSGFFSAWLMKKFSPKQVLFIGFSLILPCLLSLLLLSLTSHVCIAWFFLTTMLLYFFTGLLFPAASYFASNAMVDKASASSMMSFINMGSAMLSVIAFGYLPFSTIFAFTITLIGFYLLVIMLYAFLLPATYLPSLESV